MNAFVRIELLHGLAEVVEVSDLGVTEAQDDVARSEADAGGNASLLDG